MICSFAKISFVVLGNKSKNGVHVGHVHTHGEGAVIVVWNDFVMNNGRTDLIVCPTCVGWVGKAVLGSDEHCDWNTSIVGADFRHVEQNRLMDFAYLSASV